MYKDKKLVTFFHLLLVDNCEDIVQSYIDDITQSGLYNDCDRFYFTIRYINIQTLNNVFKMFEGYDKFHIISVNHNDADFSLYIQEHFNFDTLKDYRHRPHIMEYIQSGEVVPIFYRLGEVETIMNMICNPTFEELLSDYDYGLFFHSKSISHICKINNTLQHNSETTSDKIKNILKSAIFNYKHVIDDMISTDRFSYEGGYNITFAYKCEWFMDLDITKYFRTMKEYEGYNFSLYPKPVATFPFRRGNQFLFIGDDKIHMADRHIFADFPSNINFMVDNCGRIKLNK